MREIKFSYIYQHNDTGRILNKKFDIHEIELELMGECFMWRYTLIARRQYTGLKDKNGIQIFEGDILRYAPTWRSDSDIGVVKFQQGTFVLINLENDELIGTLAELLHDDTGNHLQIIGNIYENPEPLQGN